MTAPQHNAKALADQANPSLVDIEGSIEENPSNTASQNPSKKHAEKGRSSANHSQKLQRCWFMTIGLVGGFGFIASQMSLAMAESTYLVSDYVTDAASSDAATGSYTLSDTALNINQADFAVPPASEPAPIPATLIEASPTPAEAISAIQAPVVTPAQAPVMPAVPVAPTAPVVSTPAPAAPVVSAPVNSAASDLVTGSASDLTTAPASIEFEITPAATPAVTPVRSPGFTTAQKPVAIKPANRAHPLMAMMETSAVAAPLSAYAIDASAPSGTERALLMASQAGVASEGLSPEALTPESGAVPDILPDPVQAAPPIVEAAPPIVEAPIVEPSVVESEPIQPTEIIPASLPEDLNLPEEYNSVFVDPTDYSVGATENTQAPDVVVSESSTGCEFTVGQNQAVPNGACGTGLPSAPAPVAEAGYQEAPVAVSQPAPARSEAAAPVASEPAVNVGPVTFSASGIRLSTSAAGRDYINRSVRPLVSLQAAQDFIFPLSIPSPITSLFGFRTHPISGDYRFHAGTDIGAAQGTPVLAAQDGMVTSASNAGGYGLMVVLQHALEETQLESRYAHLAEIFVEAGKEVKKGDVIGLVGSTGNSTGPHLHFEMRQMTADGWVLVNADGLVQSSLANLVKALNSPMQALSFNLSDFNLSNLRANGSIRAVPSSSADSNSLLPGQDGIPFRPAQPNAS